MLDSAYQVVAGHRFTPRGDPSIARSGIAQRGALGVHKVKMWRMGILPIACLEPKMVKDALVPCESDVN